MPDIPKAVGLELQQAQVQLAEALTLIGKGQAESVERLRNSAFFLRSAANALDAAADELEQSKPVS